MAASHLVNQSGGGSAPSRVCLNDLCDLSCLEAAGANPNTLDSTSDHRPHRNEVREPAPLRQFVGVTDRMAHRRALAAYIAPLRHDDSLETVK